MLFYGLGKYAVLNRPPAVKIEEPAIDLTEIYDTAKSQEKQTSTSSVQGTQTLSCEGKIKGNVSSSGKIYHLPGGAFYNRTIAEICFDSEADAQAAGFRKSQR